MDDHLNEQMRLASAEADEVEKDFAADPVPRREFRGSVQGLGKLIYAVELRDLFAIAFAAAGAAPEDVYPAADEALNHRK